MLIKEEFMDIRFKPIGVVWTKAEDDEIRGESKDLEGVIEIFPEFEDALEGIDGYSHIFILCYFNKLRPDQVGPLKVKPRRLVKRGFKLDEIPELGVFALDSPTRPNPIGLTLVQVIRREGRRLIVKGIDYFNGTPVLDIKGYHQDYRTDDNAVPDWYVRLADTEGHI